MDIVPCNPVKPYLLSSFLRAAADEVKARCSVRRFIELRYDIMSVAYPHKPFSVIEAESDFFEASYRYVTGQTLIPECRPGVTITRESPDTYWTNYRDWLRVHAREHQHQFQ